jgi:threonylcarbamoyladenosine tRNA methylthiotransferase MtaB
VPGIGITTDVMVGFPGETDEAHEATIALARDVGFARMHVFRYSPRPGTEAAGLDPRVSENRKAQRAREMSAVAASLRRAFATRFLGQTMDVMAEPDRVGGAVLAGYTPNYIRVRFPAAGVRVGEVATVRLERLLGEVVEGAVTRRTEAIGL